MSTDLGPDDEPAPAFEVERATDLAGNDLATDLAEAQYEAALAEAEYEAARAEAMATGGSIDDLLSDKLREAMDAGDIPRAIRLLNSVISSFSGSKRKRDAYLWELWRLTGAKKPPDLPPFNHRSRSSKPQSESQISTGPQGTPLDPHET